MRKAVLSIFFCLLSSPVAAHEACDVAYTKAEDTRSFHECKAAAEAGITSAQFGYGLILWSGQDRVTNKAEALEWFRKSAMAGHVLARTALGRFLSDNGTESKLRNEPEAYAWWMLSGNKDSAAKLRQGLTKDQAEKADKLFKQFAAAYGGTK